MAINQKLIIAALGSFCFLFSACVSRVEYLQLKTDYLNSLIYTKNVLNQAKNTKKQRDKAKQQILKLEENKKKLLKKHEKDQADLKDLKNKNSLLQNKIEEMLAENKKIRSIIHLQGKVIELLDDTQKNIKTSLKKQIEENKIKAESTCNELKETFSDYNYISFNSGSARINEKAKNLLLKLVKSLKNNKCSTLIIAGHTDNQPIPQKLKNRFPTNWELSAARAVNVARFLQEVGGLKTDKLSVCGFSYFKPLASNDTEEGRTINRRVEIIISSQ